MLSNYYMGGGRVQGDDLGHTALHESPLCETHPPFARLASPICIEPFNQTRGQFLANLCKILSEVV